jgi:hypothetical protein
MLPEDDKSRGRLQETVRGTAQLVYITSVSQEQRGNRPQAGRLMSGEIGCDVMAWSKEKRPVALANNQARIGESKEAQLLVVD